MTWKRVPTIALRDDQLPLVLVGLPGAGKTTQARLLAQALGVQVTDTDAEIRLQSTDEILKTYGGKLKLVPINNAEAIEVHGDKFEILGR